MGREPWHLHGPEKGKVDASAQSLRRQARLTIQKPTCTQALRSMPVLVLEVALPLRVPEKMTLHLAFARDKVRDLVGVYTCDLQHVVGAARESQGNADRLASYTQRYARRLHADALSAPLAAGRIRHDGGHLRGARHLGRHLGRRAARTPRVPRSLL